MMSWIMAIIFVEAVTEIIIESSLFIRFRTWISDFRFFGVLFTCGFCFSVWVSIFTGWMLPGSMFEIEIINIAMKTFVLWRISTIWHELLSRWFHRHPFCMIDLRVTKNGNDDMILGDDDEE